MSSGFVSENELAEQRRRRQEEWEKVRTADQPVEAPEEPYDGRSLFERLEEQRKKKDEEYEEAHKLKNMVRGLDDDEVDFLDTVERLKENLEQQVRQQERAEMEQFRSAVATLAEQNLVHRLQQEIQLPTVSANKKPAVNRSSQQKLLAGAVIRKKPADKDSSKDSSPAKKMRTDPETAADVKGTNNASNNENVSASNPDSSERVKSSESTDSTAENGVKAVAVLPSTLQCIGILPGLGSYPDSSDSEHSSDSDEGPPQTHRIDLLGRVIEKETSKQKVEK